MNVLWWMQAVLSVLEIIGVFYWIRIFAERRRMSAGKKILTAAGVACVCGLTVAQREVAMYSRLYLLFCILIMWILVQEVFDEKKLFLLGLTAAYLETVYSLDVFLTIAWEELLGKSDFFWNIQLQLQKERILIYLLTRAVIGILLILAFKKKRELRFFCETVRKSCYIFPIAEHLGLLLSDSVVRLEASAKQVALRNWKLLLLLYPIMILLWMFFYFYQEKQQQIVKLESQIRIYTREYQEDLKFRWKRQQYYHDMKNHFLVMRKLLEQKKYEKLDSYLQELTEPFLIKKSEQIYCGNLLLDFLIREKVREAEKRSILVNMDFSLRLQIGRITDLDWCALLGNLWDNAIEGCERAKDVKRIKFSMKEQKNAVMIQMENTCEKKADGQELQTVKKDTDWHGIGIRSIRYVIQKYDGNFEWKYCDGIFKISILIFN